MQRPKGDPAVLAAQRAELDRLEKRWRETGKRMLLAKHLAMIKPPGLFHPM